MPRQRPYPSDLSDARWELLESTPSTWRAERRGRGLDIGRPPEHDLRRIMDAVLHVDRTGIPWRYLPHDFTPWETVYGYFAAWQKDGVFDQLNGLLRRLVREAAGRDTEPSACVLDARASRPLPTSRPPGKASTRARRSPDASAISVSTPSASRSRSGLPRPASPTTPAASTCSPASPRPTPHDHQGVGRHRLSNQAIEHGAILGIDVEVTRRDPGQKGFKVIPRRWVVERTFGWLMNHRRLARDYETHPHRSEA